MTVSAIRVAIFLALVSTSGVLGQKSSSLLRTAPLASARIGGARQVEEPEAPAADAAPVEEAPVAPTEADADAEAPAAPVDGECPDSEMTFEMVTGFVYTAPSDMLDSQPGTLMLTDCIDTCRKNSSCKSINYETGLCVLFSSNADEGQGNQPLVSTSN